MQHPPPGIPLDPTGLDHGHGQHRNSTISNISENMQMTFILTNMYIRIAINQLAVDSPRILSIRDSGKTPICDFSA
jgi:hypothetical protein